MKEITIRKALRLFLLVEVVGLGIAVLGAFLGMNACLLSRGGLVMIPGFVLLTLAGTVKAQEEVLKVVERQAPTERESAIEQEEKALG